MKKKNRLPDSVAPIKVSALFPQVVSKFVPASVTVQPPVLQLAGVIDAMVGGAASDCEK